mgnify:CR=1 FL=1
MEAYDLSLLILRNTKVVPTLGPNNGWEVGVRKDDSRVSTPCSAQEYVAWSAYNARHERVAGVGSGREPVLRGDRPIWRRNGVEVAFLYNKRGDTYIHASHTYIQFSCIHTYIHSCSCIHTFMQLYTYILTYMHVPCIHAYVRTYMHACAVH